MFEKGSLVLPQLIIGFSSIFYIAQSGVICTQSNGCNAWTGWAVACGTISLVLCIALLVCGYLKMLQNATIQTCTSAFLVVWWGVGAGTGTFEAPYIVTGNGYFAAWASFIGSLVYLSRAAEMSHADLKATALGTVKSGGYSGLTYLLFSSVVYMISAVSVSGATKHAHHGAWAWAVACSVIALVFTLGLIILGMVGKGDMLSPTVHVGIAGFFVIWFAAGAGVGTFVAPFMTTSNGYFSVWAAFFASVWYLYEAWQRRQGRDVNAPDEADPDIIVSAQGGYGQPQAGYGTEYVITSDSQPNYQDHYAPDSQLE